MSSRSLPSVSHSLLRPTQTIATSADLAAATASAIAASPSGSPIPSRAAEKSRILAGFLLNSSSTLYQVKNGNWVTVTTKTGE